MQQSSLTVRLSAHPLRRQLSEHGFFETVRHGPLSVEQTAVFLGQWWHPLHGFPTFLARCVAILPDIRSKCAVARILHQEVGEGDPSRAHEVVYVATMTGAGFSVEQVTEAPPFPETTELIEGYRSAGSSRYEALGFLFATEFADLAMVSGIGTAVRRVTGVEDLDWVDIHLRQEPDHVDEADRTMLESFQPEEQALIEAGSERMWQLWIRFFDRLEAELAGRKTQFGEQLPEAVSVVAQ